MKLKPAAKTRKPTGYIIYRGPSLLDGKPIVAIALTGKSSNSKTGALMQTYILRADVNPLDAIKAGEDESICGTCIHRGDPTTNRKRSCYVNIGQGAMAVFKAFARGSYGDVSSDPAAIRALGADRLVRLGTYGDPAAVPAPVWVWLTSLSSDHTGYTHQAYNPALTPTQRDRIAALCMVSADTPNDVAKAKVDGFRYFRIRLADEPLNAREFVCPASEEAGKRKQCADCMACNGTKENRPNQASPVIIAHGSYKRNYKTFRLHAA